jgi:hypothetical protein
MRSIHHGVRFDYLIYSVGDKAEKGVCHG